MDQTTPLNNHHLSSLNKFKFETNFHLQVLLTVQSIVAQKLAVLKATINSNRLTKVGVRNVQVALLKIVESVTIV
jgi:hypothetical protein